ncbi:retron St85 family RNA-directed DNA polymerase [Leclercia sp.]|uniref:retron St85 family RNA-directed DNA polymerase n=1 Tax=Leclercia sp. TaxID=1898428 RepID=UPI00289CC627|nr:retron St85 family RNA-directed DNA polymerase [Leclercia sp.]
MNYLDTLSASLNCSVTSLITGYVTAPKKYKTFFIQKKNGKGMREVAQPSPDVKKVQRAIVETLLVSVPVHSSAKAYIDNTSIYDNAEPHCNNYFLLKMDFKDFFPSIKPQDLIFFLKKNNIQLNSFEINIISNYLFRRKRGEKKLRLCIGAPSSPAISNIVMYDIDCKISDYCTVHNIPYTRYADDLSFSSNDIDKLKKLHIYVKSIILESKTPTLYINEEKTKFIGKGRSRRITGVVISNEGNLGVGRYARKKIRALVHLYNSGTINKVDIPYLQGMLAHIKNIEPNYYKKLLLAHGKELFIRLGKDTAEIISERE